MTYLAIEALLRSGESESVALLRDADDLAAIARTVCAFLNGKGGSAICGVAADGVVAGLPNAAELATHVSAYLQTGITPKGSLLSVSVDEVRGNQVISVDVPAGQDQPYLYQGAAWVRRRDETGAATSDELRRLIQREADRPERWERQPSPALEEGDLEAEEVVRTVREARKSGRFVWSSDQTWSVLEQLSLVLRGQLTHAADVLYARTPANRHPQVRAHATCFAEDRDSEQYLDDAVYDGPLVRVLKDVERFIRRNTKVSVSFEGRLGTTDQPEYPVEAVAEGLVNAFAHRDYARFNGGLAVRIYPSRLVIWNSGDLPEGLKKADLKRDHPSLPVNPDIAHVLYIRSLMNRVGRGTQNIVNVCRAAGLPEPEWQVDRKGVTLTLFGRASSSSSGGFSDRQVALLGALATGEEIRPGEYASRFASGVSERQARRDLRRLEAANLLERVGSGAGTRYRRTNRKWSGVNRTSAGHST